MYDLLSHPHCRMTMAKMNQLVRIDRSLASALATVMALADSCHTRIDLKALDRSKDVIRREVYRAVSLPFPFLTIASAKLLIDRIVDDLLDPPPGLQDTFNDLTTAERLPFCENFVIGVLQKHLKLIL